jgi:NADPH:quinone reductase-like Zn-dependent oxidoreductase
VKAVRLHRYGGPEELTYEDAPDPRPRDGWVAVELRAAALNWHDSLAREGRYPTELPIIPGSDGAGVRRDTGEEVVVLPSFFWGEREEAPGPDWEILGDRTDGTYAELVLVPEDHLRPKPAGLDWRAAAALPLAGLTAHRALFARGGLQPGERVLVLGAGGGVAGFLVAFAAAAGATVLVTSSSTAAIDAARERGAAGRVHNTTPDSPEAACAANDDRPFDLIIDPVGAWADALKALRPGGRLVSFGANASDQASVGIRPFYFAQHTILGTTMGSPRDFTAMLELVERMPGWSPAVGQTFPLDRAADAHRLLDAAGHQGKIVLDIA